MNDWKDDAACRDMDPHIFFGERGADVNLALAICAECPVLIHCAAYRKRVERQVRGAAVGVWGGVQWIEGMTGAVKKGAA